MMVQLLDFCSPDNLAFRAACNEAVDQAKRPLKRRLVAKLGESPDARALFSELQSRISSPESQTPTFYEMLSGDPRWRTVVAEKLAGEVRWSELANSGLAWRDKLKVVLSSFRDGENHKVARVVTAIVSSVTVAWSSDQLAGGPLYQEIKTTLSGPASLDVKLNLAAANGTLPISFVPTTGAVPIPVELQVRATADPILVSLAADATGMGVVDSALRQLAQDLTRHDDALTKATLSLNAALQPMPQLNGDAVRQELLGIREELQKIGATYDALTKEHMPGINRNLETIAREGAAGSYTIEQKRSRRIPLDSVDSASGGSSVDAILCVHAIKKDSAGYKVQYSLHIVTAAISDNCEASKDRVWIPDGAMSRIPIGDRKWILTAHDAKTRLSGVRSVTFTLRPEIHEGVPLKAVLTDVPIQAVSQ